MAKDILENKYKAKVCDKIRSLFPGCMVLALDPNDIQGIPDRLVLWKDKWAALEIKRKEKASHRPNQDYYVDIMNKMSFSSFIYPENEEEVLYDLQQAFQS